jgi:glucose/arabinose dehydrogenase
VGNAPDLLIEVKQGAWYGWPDFIGDEPVTYPTYAPERGQPPSFVVANHDEMPPLAKPLLRFPPHVAAVKFDALPPDAPAWSGQLLVALFGEEVPMTAPRWPRVGRSIARVDPSDWSLHEGIRGPFARPIDVRFNRADESLYVLDFGHFEFRKDGLDAKPRSGRLWKMRLRKHLGA